MTLTPDNPIVVAGAGPVGMSLAIEAARRGIGVTVVEPRPAGAPPSAKCTTVAARTMETFRRFGIADYVRDAGLPDDFPTDVMYATSMVGPELTRIPLPSRSERHLPGFIDSHWQTPEPTVRVSQIYLEPILVKTMAALPNITVINGASVESYDQRDSTVSVHCRRADGTPFNLTARFLVGCDGARSVVRRQMGSPLEGDADLGRTRSTLIRSSQVRALFGDRRPAWITWVANHKVCGAVLAVDGDELWLCHRAVRGADMDFHDVDFHGSIDDLFGVAGIEYEVVHHEDWTGRRQVAERFRDRNVFLAGDAAHVWVPFGGYGMNAGIADGVHLAWMMAAVLNGWADRSILEAYEAERQPITEQVSRQALAKVMENVEAISGNAIPPELSDDTAEGQELRDFLGLVLHDINRPQFAPEGLNFGYFYDNSPIIVGDHSACPGYSMGSVTPSTVPGCRMPHFDVDGFPVLDLLGSDYTLLRFNRDVDVRRFEAAATAMNFPLVIVDAERPADAEVFNADLLIVRYDQHVAWRGSRAPVDCAALLDRLRGRKIISAWG